MTIEVNNVAASSAQLTTLRADLSVARDFGTVADQAAMVALATATPGSTCYRTDTTSLWVLKVVPYSTPANWFNTAGVAVQVQNALTPASTTLAPSVDAVNAALNPAVRSEPVSFVLTRALHGNRVTHYTGGGGAIATWNIDATMLPGDYGRVIQTGAGPLTVVDGTGDVLYSPVVGAAPIVTTADGDYFDWECTGTNEITITSTGKGVAGSVAADTLWDAKGDIAVGTGANTASRLAVGTNGWTLQADSSTATGLKWASPGSSPLTVIDLPAGSSVGASQTGAVLATVTIPGNTFLAGKQMEVTAFINFQHEGADSGAVNVKLGGTILGRFESFARSYGGQTKGITLVCRIFAESNSSQWATEGMTGIQSNASNSVNSFRRSAAIDCTANATLSIEITTGAGTVSVQCLGGKVVVL